MFLNKLFKTCGAALILFLTSILAGCGGGGESSSAATLLEAQSDSASASTLAQHSTSVSDSIPGLGANLQPTRSTISSAAGKGVSIVPTSVLVESGKSISFALTLLPGFSHGIFDGCGIHVEIDVAGTSKVDVGPVASGCVIGGKARSVAQSLNVSTSAGEGTSLITMDTSVESGKSASITAMLLPGFSNGVFDGCGAHFTLSEPGTANFTTEPVYSNCVITSSASKLVAIH